MLHAHKFFIGILNYKIYALAGRFFISIAIFTTFFGIDKAHSQTPKDIRFRQSLLHSCGYLPSSQVDGFQGPVTTNAAKSFQASVRLIADGIIGDLTLQALKTCSGENNINSVKKGSSRNPSTFPMSDWKLIARIPLKREMGVPEFLSPYSSYIWARRSQVTQIPGKIPVEWIQKAIFTATDETLTTQDISYRIIKGILECSSETIIQDNTGKKMSVYWTRYGKSTSTAASILYRRFCK